MPNENTNYFHMCKFSIPSAILFEIFIYLAKVCLYAIRQEGSFRRLRTEQLLQEDISYKVC